ncbi:MAG: hypothetical protein KatS3mg105_4831 [Gemmatales bacterium]|nr:MAG: hypothetical protein KatS3mg105_4831 [Gemmatales bacterium]
MPRFLNPSALLALAALTLVAAPAHAQDKKSHAPYVHVVVFYVKKDAPKGTIEAVIADAHKLLADIPSVRLLKIGRPAEKSTPEVSVKDYQVGLLCLFDDYAGLKAYLEHPQHLKYVAKHKDHFEKVLVYDFINQKK